jgi:hypothetical protein
LRYDDLQTRSVQNREMKLSMQVAFHVMLMKDVMVDGPFDWLRFGGLPGTFTGMPRQNPSARQISQSSLRIDSPKFEILVISPRYDWV